MRRFTTGLFVLLMAGSAFARECKSADPVSSITNLKIKLKKELKLEKDAMDYVHAYFTNGKMTTKYLSAVFNSVYNRQIVVKFDPYSLENDILKPFECDVSVYEGQWHESDMKFYNCPIKGFSVSRSVPDLRSDMSVSYGSLKYNLGDSFSIQGECHNL